MTIVFVMKEMKGSLLLKVQCKIQPRKSTTRHILIKNTLMPSTLYIVVIQILFKSIYFLKFLVCYFLKSRCVVHLTFSQTDINDKVLIGLCTVNQYFYTINSKPWCHAFTLIWEGQYKPPPNSNDTYLV